MWVLLGACRESVNDCVYYVCVLPSCFQPVNWAIHSCVLFKNAAHTLHWCIFMLHQKSCVFYLELCVVVHGCIQTLSIFMGVLTQELLSKYSFRTAIYHLIRKNQVFVAKNFAKGFFSCFYCRRCLLHNSRSKKNLTMQSKTERGTCEQHKCCNACVHSTVITRAWYYHCNNIRIALIYFTYLIIGYLLARSNSIRYLMCLRIAVAICQ